MCSYCSRELFPTPPIYRGWEQYLPFRNGKSRKVRVVLMGKAGRPPAVEGHPQRDAILEALLTPGANYSEIQREFGISEKSLDTFRRKYVTAPMQAMLDRTVGAVPLETVQRDVMARLDNLVHKAEKMLWAADAWLEDPNAPGRYNLNPRTHEVDIVYERKVGNLVVRKTEKLGKLMADVEGKLGITVVKGETKTADPRKLLLEAVATLKPVIELIGKATGQIKPDPGATVNLFFASGEWLGFRDRLYATLERFPDALTAVEEEFRAVGR